MLLETLIVCDHARVLLFVVDLFAERIAVFIGHHLRVWKLLGLSTGIACRLLLQTLESRTGDAHHLLEGGCLS